MSRKIIYIVNPISGTRTQKNLRQLLEEKTKQKGIPFDIFPSVASGDYSFLHQKIKKEKITDVVIAGGDGTVSQVVGSLMDLDLNFGIIPCGSGNGLALAAKISKQPDKTLDMIFAGKASLIDGFVANGRFACMLCGLGFDAKVAHDFVDQPARGLTTYMRLALKNFFTVKPYNFKIQIQDTAFETDAYFISIANSNQFGNNFTIAPRASLTDGLLDVVIITAQNKVSFILQTLGQFAGWNALQATPLIKQKSSAIYFQTDQISIINKSQAPLHIDGEPAETPKTLNIEIRKKCFRLIQPA
jgi:diacylglycerol kinase (ATP)